MPRPRNNALDACGYAMLRIGHGILALTPFPLTRLLTCTIARLTYIVDRRHRRRAIDHILHAGLAADRKSAARMAQQSFRSVALTVAEFIHGARILARRTPEESFEVCADHGASELIRTDAACIILTAHLGNWELIAMAPPFPGKRILAVQREGKNAYVRRFAQKLRLRHRLEVVGQRGSLRQLQRGLRDGHIASMLADQHAQSRFGVEVELFGQRCRAHTAPARLSILTGAPILVGVVERLDDDLHFRVHCRVPAATPLTGDREHDVQAITQGWNDVLEDLIRIAPQQWMWAHRRWLGLHRKG